MNRDNVCCFTGHRIIRQTDIGILPQRLDEIIEKLYKNGVTDYICGGALGFDTIAAKAVLKLRSVYPDIRLHLALPCLEQDKNWKSADREVYRHILDSADDITYVSQVEYYDGCMQKRNRYMIEKSAHCVFYMTINRGGTHYTVRYALENELHMYNILRGPLKIIHG